MRRARIGDLDQHIVLEQPVDALDDIGSVTRIWSLVDEVWAQITPISGREDFTAERDESVLTHRILIRWRPDVTGAMRLRHNARCFNIHAAIDWDESRRFMLLQCQEIA